LNETRQIVETNMTPYGHINMLSPNRFS